MGFFFNLANSLFEVRIDLAQPIALVLYIFGASLLQTVQLLQQFHVAVVFRFEIFVLLRQFLPVAGQLLQCGHDDDDDAARTAAE